MSASASDTAPPDDAAAGPGAVDLLWFLKAPVQGCVKTRLAREIGEEAALEAYRIMVDTLWARLARRFPSTVCYDPPLPAVQQQLATWLPGAAGWLPQCPGHLGDRLTGAFAQHFARGGGPAIAIGGDCPGLDTATIRAAGRALHQVDIVIGPAFDGGYVLIGLRQPAPAVFQEIDWSTDQVLEQTLARARAAGLSWKLLDPMEDVDDAASWSRVRVCLGG